MKHIESRSRQKLRAQVDEIYFQVDLLKRTLMADTASAHHKDDDKWAETWTVELNRRVKLLTEFNKTMLAETERPPVVSTTVPKSILVRLWDSTFPGSMLLVLIGASVWWLDLPESDMAGILLAIIYLQVWDIKSAMVRK